MIPPRFLRPQGPTTPVLHETISEIFQACFLLPEFSQGESQASVSWADGVEGLAPILAEAPEACGNSMRP